MAAPTVTYGLFNRYHHVAELVRGGAAGATEIAGALTAMLVAIADADAGETRVADGIGRYAGPMDGTGGVRVTA